MRSIILFLFLAACQGSKGKNGQDGTMGPRGISGEPGQSIGGGQGLQGLQGLQGPPGPSGLPGVRGKDGDAGPQGFAGPQGKAGSKCKMTLVKTSDQIVNGSEGEFSYKFDCDDGEATDMPRPMLKICHISYKGKQKVCAQDEGPAMVVLPKHFGKNHKEDFVGDCDQDDGC